MDFFGVLANLEWDTIEERHQCYWEKLRTKYNLSTDQIDSPKSLDDLAKQCVRLCRKKLFSEPGTSLSGWRMQTKHGISCVVDVEEALTPALYDHLVITFAHRFYCDNLEPKSMRKCLSIIYDCQGNPWEGTQYASGKDFQREQKKNIIDANALKCQNYSKGIELFITSFKSWLLQLYAAEEGGRISSSTENMLKRKFSVLDGFLKRRDLFAAPNWLFTVVMANNWKHHPFHVQKRGWAFAGDYASKENLLLQLASFLGDNSWLPLLIGKEATSQEPMAQPCQPVECEVNEPPCVRISCKSDSLACKQLPAQKYNFRRTKQQIELPTATQLLFNNYLLEQNFHGYAITVALDCIKARMGDFDLNKNGVAAAYLNQYLELPFAIRLHSPIVHPELIRITGAVIGQVDPEDRSVDCLSWLDWFISIWNTEALPILEELFLWGVYTYFKLDVLLDEINRSLLQRGDRLNRYRFISPADIPPEEYDKSYVSVVNEIVKNSYLAGLGARCTDDICTGVRFDSGMRTVLDD